MTTISARMRSPAPDHPQTDFGFRTPPKRRLPRRGRPRKPDRLVPHARRLVERRYPQHVTLRMQPHVWQLRSRRCFGILERAFLLAAARLGTRICHFSVQHNHIHMVLEADDAHRLARAIQGLAIRMAKGLNRLMERKGAVFADRYHARELRTPTEVRRAIVYVLRNGQKHLPRVGHRMPSGWQDPYSSAAWFDGWSVATAPMHGPAPVAAPSSWLLSVGYRRVGGPLRPDELPADASR